MRIAFFIDSLSGGGAARVASLLTAGWAEEGHEVALITLDTVANDFYAVSGAVTRIGLDRVGDSRNSISGMIANVGRVRALRITLRRLRPDVVVAFQLTNNVLAIIASLGLCPVVVSERTDPARLAPRAWRILRRITYRGARAIVVMTPAAARWTAQRFGARVIVISNPIMFPLPRLVPVRDPSTVVSGKQLLLAAGRLEDVKGFDDLIVAFSKIAVKHPQWCLVILGEGSKRYALEALASARSLDGRAILAGEVGNIGDWYGRADLFALPSRVEGFPNVLIEALSYGVPCVSYDCDFGPRDIIVHGVNGWMVPCRDVRGLAESLDFLMSDDDTRRRLSQNAPSIRDKLSTERVRGCWTELFSTLVERD